MSIDHFAADVVSYHRRSRPDAPAIEDAQTGAVLTWRALEERVAGLAGALADDLDVSKGDRVAVLANNDPWVLIVQFACMRLGAIFVPLNFRLARAELEFLCIDSEPAVLIYDVGMREVAVDVAAAAGVRQLASFHGAVGAAATGAAPDTCYDLVAGAAIAAPRPAASVGRLTDPVQLLYTSGTTGRPKGAICTHQTLHYQTLNSLQPYELSSTSCYLAVLPFFHAAGLNSMTNPVLALGGTVVVAHRFDPVHVVELLADPGRGITHFSAAPVMYQVMSSVPEFADADFSHLRHGQIGGGSLNWEVLNAFHDRGWPLSTGYGSTEMGPIVSVVPPAASLTKFGSCGLPVQYTVLRLVGPDGQDVEPGQTGEVWAHGPAVTPGYWRRNRDEDEAFVGEWFRTGDALTQDADGFLTMVDRFKDMYKSGGENVYPAEVERVVQEHPDVEDAAVISIADERWGEVGRALIIPKPGVVVDTVAIAEHCRTRLAKYKVPADFVVVEPFERNVTGKLPKAELKRKYGSDRPTVTLQQ
ncbi:class I adenylate-forming enzyme family protein [Mycobacterium talmoniae]|uniref:Acyl-CoA synthetase n=1 Tax=Mycobacterium talmoniae TaxID=1858794 RepID=A0A1S1NPH3_9MYCO|nr:AMP-binding protein [Mycobacterium talmoniae]OHV06900.1 acyl-CoA synthetase [Mycobacterium talmoniae]PQM47971.1 Long-chain-fatty-acid--CoA ligase [Mycobacterium talmoniae]